MTARRQLPDPTFDRTYDCFEGFAKATRMVNFSTSKNTEKPVIAPCR